MIYTKNTKKALELCFTAHRDQRDKSGMPYVFHPFHLAEQMNAETTTVVASTPRVAMIVLSIFRRPSGNLL